METVNILYTKNRTAIFDWLVISISFLLSFIFPTISQFIASPDFYIWMLSAILFYSIGAYFKDFFLSYRLSQSGQITKIVSYKGILIIGHFIILYMATVVVKPAIANIFNIYPSNRIDSNLWFLIAFLYALLTTWIVYRNKRNRKPRKVYTQKILFGVELVADILLIAGVAIFTFVFWEKGVLEMLGRTPTDSIGGLIFLFLFLSILFVFFYLPLRYLFFIEDRKSGQNWRRLTYIFGFILLRSLFELLSL